MGVTAISQAVDIAKLRSLARVQAWRKVCSLLAALFDFVAEGASYHRSQMYDAAEKNLERARLDALPYDASYVVGTTREVMVNDPYRYLPEDDRTL